MTYTAEQLRRDAIAIERMHGETLTVEWRGHQASQLRAHADTLEENARLTRECEFHAKQCARVDELRHRAEAELTAERERADRLMRLAYLAGWNASGEGYNAEYPFGDSDMDPKADAKWIAVRDTALDAARRK